jgi:16S rRNA (cytosine1402-N4)-methyltransferase
MSHEPVLLKEVLQQLDPQPGDFMIDGTMDGGGHATAIMKKIFPTESTTGKFLGIDWDAAMVARAEERIKNDRSIFIHGNYADLPEILEKISTEHFLRGENISKADGLLLDLGFSSEQLEHAEESGGTGRGFSFSKERADEPLLMTYDDAQEPVWKILRELDEAELANIIYEFGGERFSRSIAKAIKERGRRTKGIMSAGELATTVREALPKGYERGRIDPATRTFQALRIYANGELKNLKTILENVGKVVKPGGRVVIISFHSLEDRIVKQSFQKLAKEEKAELLTKKPIVATREEISKNPRSRSAKLRAIKII